MRVHRVVQHMSDYTPTGTQPHRRPSRRPILSGSTVHRPTVSPNGHALVSLAARVTQCARSRHRVLTPSCTTMTTTAPSTNPGSLGCELLTEIGCGVQHTRVPVCLATLQGQHDRGQDHRACYGPLLDQYGQKWLANLPMSVRWPKYDTKGDQNLRIASPITVESRFAQKRCDFWSTLPRRPHICGSPAICDSPRAHILCTWFIHRIHVTDHGR